MVMRNRGDGSDAPHWWDDLPPQIRARFTQPLVAPDAEPHGPTTVEPAPPVSGGELIGAIARLAVVFALLALVNVLFLFAAIYFVYG